MVTTASTKQYHGMKVLGGKKGKRKIGKVFHTVFDPQKPYVVGFIVKRPDLLWMFKRKDKFIAFDATEIVDGRVHPTMGGDSWDAKAIERLDLDYDKCIIWENMPIQSDDGSELGRVTNVTFDARTGKVISLNSGDGATAKLLLGTYELPLSMIRGYSGGALVVTDEATSVEASGGLAEKAGEGTAKAGAKMKVASKKTGEAVNKGAYKLGESVGKTSRAMDETKELYKKEVAGNDSQEPATDTLSYNLGKVIGKGRDAIQKHKDSSDEPVEVEAVVEDEDPDKRAPATAKTKTTKPAAKKKPRESGDEDGGDDDGSGVGGMFSAFKSEFDKARKGE